MKHPYPVGTPCIIINSKLDGFLGRFCQIGRPLDMYGLDTDRKRHLGYIISLDNREYFARQTSVLAISPNIPLKEKENAMVCP
jgi:hypothetical protein